jgi:pseudouridine-5'-phosphate glycosidase/pseudouridine kinase
VFRVSPEVKEAVDSRKPIVALETSIYTHGFPYPDNVALASHLESVVRLNGGIPATIGVLHGVARVGLEPKELIELASAAGEKETMKVSRRDIPYITGLVSSSPRP